MNTLTADLGGTKTKLALIRDGEVIEHASIDSLEQNGLSALLDSFNAKAEELLTRNGVSKNELAGIGLSFAGVVDHINCRVLSTNEKFVGAEDFLFKEWAAEYWNLPLALENDARASLLGSYHYGVAQEARSAVVITIGTGIGTAVLVDDQLLRGPHFTAGNLGGHFAVNSSGHKCSCGNIGCVESEASNSFLPLLAQRESDFPQSQLNDVKVIDYKAIFDLAPRDHLAQKLKSHLLRNWGVAAVNMIHAYDPEVLVFNGGVMKRSEEILPAIEEHIKTHAWTIGEVPQLCVEPLSETAALLGMHAALLTKNESSI